MSASDGATRTDRRTAGDQRQRPSWYDHTAVRPMRERLSTVAALARAALTAVSLVLAFVGAAHGFAIAFAASLAAAGAGGGDRPIDRAADLATAATIPLALHWLEPWLPGQEPVAYWLMVGALAVPPAYVFIKYGVLPGFRTRAGQTALLLGSATAILVVVTGAAWPLWLGAVALVLAALESIA